MKTTPHTAAQIENARELAMSASSVLQNAADTRQLDVDDIDGIVDDVDRALKAARQLAEAVYEADEADARNPNE